MCCRGNGSTTVAGVLVRSWWRREEIILREASLVFVGLSV